MITTFILFLPCFVALAFAFICAGARRKYYNRHFFILCVCVAIYFFVDSAYVTPGVDARTAITLDPIGITFELCIIPALVTYLFEQWKKRPAKVIVYTTYIPAIVMGTMMLCFLFVAGRSNVAAAVEYSDAHNFTLSGQEDANVLRYFFVSTTLSRPLLGTELFLGFVFMIYMAIMKAKEGTGSKRFVKLTVFGVLSIVLSGARIILTRAFLIQHPFISCVISICLALIFAGFCYTHASPQDVREGQDGSMESEPEADVPVKEEMPSNEQVVERNQVADSEISRGLLALLDDEKAYLLPGLSIESVAERLGTNRTYISMIINKNFGKTFREFVNERRIATAKEFMLANPQSKVEEIAEVSGFAGGSQFCRKFKEMEGVTPNMWLRSHK